MFLIDWLRETETDRKIEKEKGPAIIFKREREKKKVKEV